DAVGDRHGRAARVRRVVDLEVADGRLGHLDHDGERLGQERLELRLRAELEQTLIQALLAAQSCELELRIHGSKASGPFASGTGAAYGKCRALGSTCSAGRTSSDRGVGRCRHRMGRRVFWARAAGTFGAAVSRVARAAPA